MSVFIRKSTILKDKTITIRSVLRKKTTFIKKRECKTWPGLDAVDIMDIKKDKFFPFSIPNESNETTLCESSLPASAPGAL